MQTLATFTNWIFVFLKLLEPDCCTPTDASLFNTVPWMNLSSSDIHLITRTTSLDALRQVFNKINVVRQVDTPAHASVRQYIMNYLADRGWSVETDSFTEHTVIGPKTFHNIIARLGSPRSQDMVLACHYDSKQIPGFVGSIDSAIPCAIILQVADQLTDAIVRQKNPLLGLQLVFFDGEEAFERWSATDSLYGARHLAMEWSKPDRNGQTKLSKIKLLVLLDLIGAPNLVIPDYGYTSEPYYDLLVRLERSMRQVAPHLYSHHSSSHYFGYSTKGVVQDDHIPFVERRVPVLHLIPSTFPDVWHSIDDDENHVSWEVSVNMLNLMIAFVRSTLHLIP